MAEKSQIQWTSKTWNPFHGCKKVSEGCKFCYMYRDKERYGQDPTTVLRSKSTFNDPIKWHKHLTGNEPFTERLVFTCSWSDWFIEEADGWRDECWKIIKDTPHLIYQILTKRPERIADHLPADWGEGYPNVWLGVSVENQANADKRIPILLETPAKTRFLSIEPLLGEIDIFATATFHCEKPGALKDLHWIIIGGESGNENGKYKYRPCEIGWIRYLLYQTNMVNIPTFIKQMGTHLAKELNLKDSHGGDISEFPTDLQIREFPI